MSASRRRRTIKQRDYGTAGQIGREATVHEYLERLWGYSTK